MKDLRFRVATSAILSLGSVSAALAATGVCDVVPPKAIEVEASAGIAQAGYARLSAAFDAINAGTHRGTIAIEVCGNTTELAPGAELNASGSGSSSYTSISIKPVGGAARTISGALSTYWLIILSGADNVTIDGVGSGGNALTISNTGAGDTAATIVFRFGADNNVVTNATILGSFNGGLDYPGATVYFFNQGDPSGPSNNNNTIANCNIGPAAGGLPMKAVHVHGSSYGPVSINNVITNNNIYDFSNAGILVEGWTSGCTISNNRLYQTATRGGNSHRPIGFLGRVDGAMITGNVIGYGSATQTGTYALSGPNVQFAGIFFGGGGGTQSKIVGNTIASISVTGVSSSSSPPFMAILVDNNHVEVSNNTIGSQAAAGSLVISTNTLQATQIYGIWTTSGPVHGNSIGGIVANNVSSGAITIDALYARFDLVPLDISSNVVGGTMANSIQNLSNAAGSDVNGIRTSGGHTTVTANTIRNLTASVGSVKGLFGAGVRSVVQNTIFNLARSSTAPGGSVTGIRTEASLPGDALARNFVHSLTSTGATGSSITGIAFGGGACQNNMIALASGVTGNVSITGITDGTDGSESANSYYFNSVYIGGSDVSGTTDSYAFRSARVLEASVCKDNIFFNARSNGSGTGKHYAIDDSTTGSATLSSDFNVLYSPGQGGKIGRDAGVDYPTLGGWQAATGRDLHSFSFDPNYVGPTQPPPNLHIGPAFAVVEGQGTPIAGIDDDFDGEVRSSLTPTDIGADAGNFSTDRCGGVTCQSPDVCASYACNPANGSCAPNYFPETTVCRAALGECDIPETCSGAAVTCPADAKRTDTCRPAAGNCDVAESCNGVSDACPSDVVAPAGIECRASTDTCDPAEYCSGNGATCPQDVVDAGAAVGNSLQLRHDRQSAVTTITWTEVDPGPFNVYRGELTSGAAWVYNQACFASGLPEATTSDATSPVAGQLFFYLISRVEQSCGESALGFDSMGNVRPNAAACE